MKNINIIVFLTIFSLFSLPKPAMASQVTVAEQSATVSQQKLWPSPSELSDHTFGDSKTSWACSEVNDPNAPPSPPGSFPNIPGFPQIPGIQIPPIQIPGIQIPGFPNIPQITIPGFPSINSVSLSQSKEMKKCLSKNAEKCFSQIFTSWAENDLALDQECCEIVVNMENTCNDHIHFMFKSPYFAPLLQYSCHIKHAKKN